MVKVKQYSAARTYKTSGERREPFTCIICGPQKAPNPSIHSIWFKNPEDIDPESLFFELIKHGIDKSTFFNLEINSSVTQFELDYVVDTLNMCNLWAWVGYAELRE